MIPKLQCSISNWLGVLCVAACILITFQLVRKRMDMKIEEEGIRNTSVNVTTDHNTNKNLILIGFGTYSELKAHSEFGRFYKHFDGYNIHIFNLKSARQKLVTWQELDALKAFKKLSHDVMRADLFSIVAAYHMGGFYIDLKSGFQVGKDVKCLEKLSSETWFMLNSAGLIDSWNMFSVRGSLLFKHVKTRMVSEILSGRQPKGDKFDLKVLDTTGPLALRRIIPTYNNLKLEELQPSEEECLVYDVRGAGSSWKDPGSYHKEPVWKSVYEYVYLEIKRK